MANIFISYRRESGADIAARVRDFFAAKGFNVFYDIKSMQLGEFDKQIIQNINTSQYFILILSKNALDRCSNENDWVRKEIECALQNDGIQIIPLLLPQFEFPANLPPSLEKIKYFHGVEYNAVLFDLVMDRLFQLINRNDGVTETENDEKKFVALLDGLYAVSIEFREVLRNGNQAKFNEVFGKMASNMQSLYYCYEKFSYTEPQLANIARAICNRYNAFAQYYNEFANSRDRLSETAQRAAQLAEIEFGEFVSLILTALKELKQR